MTRGLRTMRLGFAGAAAGTAASLLAGLFTSASAAPAGSISAITPAAAPNDQRVRVTFRTSTPFPLDNSLTRVQLVHTRLGARIFGELGACLGTTQPGVGVSPGTLPTIDPRESPLTVEGSPSVNPSASPVRPGDPPHADPTVSPTADTADCGVSNEIVATLPLAPELTFDGSRSSTIPGTYDAFVYIAGTNPRAGDSCQACFTVQHSGSVFVFSMSPSELPAGTSGQVVVSGHNFSPDAIVEAVYVGTNVVDRSISFFSAGVPGDPRSRPSSLLRNFVVGSDSKLGLRDILVRVPYGATGRLRRGVRIVRR